MSVIEIKDLILKSGAKILLNNINLSVDQGETVVISGPSGMGKSVLLKLCVGLIQPTAGKIIIDGEDITTMSEKELNKMRNSIGMLFQNYGLFDSMTVAENVGFFLYEHSSKSNQEIQTGNQKHVKKSKKFKKRFKKSKSEYR